MSKIKLLSLCLSCFVLFVKGLNAFASSKAYFLYHNALQAAEGPGDETIVMMHGLLGEAKNFMTVAKLLQKKTKADVIVFDLRSHGRSSVYGDLELEYREMAEDVLFSIMRLGLDKTPVHLIGHSLGGKVAAATSLLSEKRGVDIRSLTLLDISPVEYSEDEFDEVFETLDFLEETHEGMKAGMNKKDMAKLIDDKFEDKSFSMFLQSNLVLDERSSNVQWKFSVPGIAQSRENILKWPFGPTEKFERPILLVKGGDSPFVKSAHLERIKQHFPLYTLQSEKGAGHWLHAEKPEETAERIGQFMVAANDWNREHEQESGDE